MADGLRIDLRLRFPQPDEADLMAGAGDLETVGGLDNLEQALKLRLLVDRGELTALGHPRYGSRVRELIGEPLDRANLQLLRRYVRHALAGDPRVAEVVRVDVQPRPDVREAVDVRAKVRAIDGGDVAVEATLNVG